MSSASDTSSERTPPDMDPVLQWYARIYSRRIDIVGDYAGSELFLIDGESLLLNTFSDKSLDFCPGFQLLHAVYATERFLKGLLSRRCNFHIAFFHDHRELCIPPFAPTDSREKYQLARAAIIRHLLVNLKDVHPEIEIRIFSSVSSDAFQSYLRASDIYFVMCHDGASPGVLRTRNILSKHLDAFEDEDHDTGNETLKTKIAFRQLIHWFKQHGYAAALINGLEWRDTKAIATVLETPAKSGSGISLTIEPTQPHAEPDSQYLSRSTFEKVESSAQSELTESQYITVLVLSTLLLQKKIMPSFVSAFLRHTALLSQLHLSERLIHSSAPNTENEMSLRTFCATSTDVLLSSTWGSNLQAWNRKCDVADIIDGHLLCACIDDESLGLNGQFQALVQAVASLGADGLVAHNPVVVQKTEVKPKEIVRIPKQDPYAVLPFSNDAFDPHLSPIHLAVDRSEDVFDTTSANIFREVTHWHNSKRPMDPKVREDQIARNKKQLFFARRRNQFFMAEMTAYAASLTNAVGKVLEPEIIASTGQTEKVEEHTKPKVNTNANPKSGKKSGPTKKEAMLAEIAANRSRKEDATAESLLKAWRSTCHALNKEPTPIIQYKKARQYIATLNTDLKLDTLEAEVRLFMLNSLLAIWLESCRDSDSANNLHIAALIFDTINSFAKSRRSITIAIADCLDKTLKYLSLPKVNIPSPDGNRALAFKFLLAKPPPFSVAINLPSLDFQLQHCGPYFDRSMDSAPDPRVPFEPDAWQRKVLDEIDARRSLLVVAPTSAGKTFISFYAMKQVLESKENDVLVYVAPTKALVNQIAAEVQARFSKSYKYPGNSVWGIHTRDYRINNPTGCQILVTVPHILQIMLLAPSNANSWSRRIKWIIFDEVHCIGQADDGLIWEQLLLMAPCPIIALSATIGNPHEFSAWLSSTQRSLGNDLTMVQHPHRYSDLRKFVYKQDSARGFRFKGLPEQRGFARLGLDDCADFHFLHPVASLVNRARGMPPDLSLESRDCLAVWQSMDRHQTATHPVDPSLSPTVALPAIINKVDVLRWEASLKDVLREWMKDPKSPYEAVLDDLSRPIGKPGTSLEGNSDNTDDEDEEESEYEEYEAESMHGIKSILHLLSRLHEQDALPGILFSYDRSLCEKICLTLMSQLDSAERSWKETSAKWKATLQKWEEWKKVMSKVGKRGVPKLPKKKGAGGADESLTKEDLARDAASTETSPWASFDPDKPVDGFHFADNKKLSHEDLAAYEKELRRREVPEWLLSALHRGIGVHHAGLNRKYRQVCEMLFRKGYLRVVIATGTLALGINMPCKTVVFSGDSVFLTALNYRQAAGRAGRRGFDNLGNVVFHGISLGKIHRLISSRLPDINGHFPVTTTLVLRLFTLLNESKNSPFAIQSVNALLSQPRLYLGGEESKMTVLHHLRFSIEYLRRQFLLDSRGVPLNLAGCVSHLYFTENSSFAFHALLKDGYFHQLCSNFDGNQEDVLRELMLTMSHLFGRQYCRQADGEFLENVVKRSPSIVFLPPMPARGAEILRNHNQSTLDIYKAYVRTFVEQYLHEPDDMLPLTQWKVAGDSASQSAIGLPRPSPTVIRSPFVALSGHGDDFESIHDLCSTTRSGVFLEEAVVPYVGLYPEESEMPLNAYLYDFFMHGDVKALATANRIRPGDVWFVLNDFSMVLATIVTSLSNFMNLTPESDLDYTEIRGEGEDAEERQEDKLLPPDDSGYETASTVSTASKATGPVKSLPMQTKKKKKVAESWDDDADEEDFQEEIANKKEKARAKAQLHEEKPAWEEGTGLLNVLKAFKALKQDFDTKFRAMWA